MFLLFSDSFFSMLPMITTTTTDDEINFLAQMTPEETAEFEAFLDLLDNKTEYQAMNDFLIAEYKH